MQIAVKKHGKTDKKLFFFYPVLLEYSIFFPKILSGIVEGDEEINLEAGETFAERMKLNIWKLVKRNIH